MDRAYEVAALILKDGERPKEVESLLGMVKAIRLEEKLPKAPPPARAVLLLAESYTQEGKKAKANKLLDIWLQGFERGVWPSRAQAREWTLVLEELARRGALSRKRFETFLQKLPSSVELWRIQAVLAEQAGFPQEGLEGLKAIALNIPAAKIEREIARLRAYYALDDVAARKRSQVDLVRMLEEAPSLLGCLDYRIGEVASAWKRLAPLPPTIPTQVRRIRAFAGLALGTPGTYPKLLRDLEALAKETGEFLLEDLAHQARKLAGKPPSSPR